MVTKEYGKKKVFQDDQSGQGVRERCKLPQRGPENLKILCNLKPQNSLQKCLIGLTCKLLQKGLNTEGAKRHSFPGIFYWGATPPLPPPSPRIDATAWKYGDGPVSPFFLTSILAAPLVKVIVYLTKYHRRTTGKMQATVQSINDNQQQKKTNINIKKKRNIFFTSLIYLQFVILCFCVFIYLKYKSHRSV